MVQASPAPATLVVEEPTAPTPEVVSFEAPVEVVEVVEAVVETAKPKAKRKRRSKAEVETVDTVEVEVEVEVESTEA